MYIWIIKIWTNIIFGPFSKNKCRWLRIYFVFESIHIDVDVFGDVP